MQVRVFPEITWPAAFEATVAAPPAGMDSAQSFDFVKSQVTPGTVYVDGLPQFDGERIVVAAECDRDRIVVDGIDLTYFRGIHTATPAFLLTQPFAYGSTTLEFPQVSPVLESGIFGTGDLSWLRMDAPVRIERVRDGVVVARDYRGFISAINADGATLTVEVAGEYAGRAAMLDRQVPLFKSQRDVGLCAYEVTTGALRLPWGGPRLGPVTGIKIANQGGMTQLDWANRVCSMSSTLTGQQRTIMPVSDTSPEWEFRPKDLTTIHATVYFDDADVVQSLKRDKTEEPTDWYAGGITPEGMKVKNGAYPGLVQGIAPPYPKAGGASFGIGTTNADLINPADDDLGAMLWRLDGMGYLSRADVVGGYDADAADAIKELQHDANLAATGTMNPATWDALYDLGVTGYNLSQSAILPMVQDDRTRMWDRTASGARLARNPFFDADMIPVARTIQFGAGYTKQQMRRWTRGEFERGQVENWVGEVRFNGFGLIRGEHNPGDPAPTSADVMSIRELRPGMNVWAPRFRGGVLFHVPGVSIDAGGREGTATFDTKNRDLLAVTEILQRNQDSKSDPTRAFLTQHRKSSQTQDSMTTFDEVGGRIFDAVYCDADDWTVFPVVAGQEGEAAKLRLQTTGNACEFVTAIFALEPSRAWLNDVISNPFARAGDGEIKWTRESLRTRIDKKVLLYVAGTAEQPCGYAPGQKYSEDADGNRVLSPDPVTGLWEDDANFHYHTLNAPVLWVAVYTKQACRIPRGRILWPQLEEGQ